MLSCIGIGGAVIVMAFVIAVFRPVFSNMKEDIFLKIGSNRNVWGKHSLANISTDVYKYLSVSKSFLKLDLVNCVEFMITGIFVWFTIF